MKNVLFSVLIANYNNAEYICRALDSVINQSYDNWEIIIVDDASSDDSRKVVLPYLSNDRIKFYKNQENHGCGYTKRRSIELATGEICGFLDPDDALVPEALETMIESHLNFPLCSLCYSTHFVCDERLNPVCVFDRSRQIPEEKTYLDLADGSISHFASFKRRLYDTTCGINPDLPKAVDQDLYYKMEEVGLVRFIEKPLYYYRIHSGGISTGANVINAGYWNQHLRENAYWRRLNAAKEAHSSRQHISDLSIKFHDSAGLNAIREGKLKKFLFHSKKYFAATGISLNSLKYLRRIFLVYFNRFK